MAEKGGSRTLRPTCAGPRGFEVRYAPYQRVPGNIIQSRSVGHFSWRGPIVSRRVPASPRLSIYKSIDRIDGSGPAALRQARVPDRKVIILDMVTNRSLM